MSLKSMRFLRALPFTATKVSVTDMDQHIVEHLGRRWETNFLPAFASSHHNDL